MADVSLFTSQLKLRRYDESTLRILKLTLASKDVKLMLHLRSELQELLRSETLTAFRHASDKPVELKLLILDFFVRAFAIVDDVESCLALRYEGLVMRDSSAVSYPELRVSCSEWTKFAEDAFDNAFYSVAAKACESALLLSNIEGDAGSDYFAEDVRGINQIQMLKNAAFRLSSSHSVQAQSAEYMRKKTLNLKQTSFSKEAECPASISFRNGIKLRNARNLIHLRNQ